MRINTNILSLSAQRNLAVTNRALARAMEKLASGKRVNFARDDAAGLAIGGGLESQRRGILQAIRNINDSRGFLNTADGTLAEQTNIVQRLRELAMQAANGTISDTGRGYLNAEAQALAEEFNRLTEQTAFNGVNLLDGSFGTKNLQVSSRKGDTISLSLTNMKASNVFTKEVNIGTGTFQTRSTLSTGTGPYGISSADLNDDGYMDIITNDYGSNFASISLGNGDGTFQTRSTIATGNGPTRVTTGDINGDGYLDLISSDDTSSTISLRLGNGDGTFQTRTTIAAGTSPYSVMTADFNNDGDLDLGWVNYQASGLVTISLGNGDGTFQTRSTLSAGAFPTGVMAADLNADNILDLVSTTNNGASSVLSVFIGNGNGTFATRTTIAAGDNPIQTVTGDVNGDGYVDIMSSDINSNSAGLYLGNGNGTFGSRSGISVGSGPYGIALEDLNGDDRLDLISADGTDGTLSIRLGNGDGTFQARRTLNAGTGPSRVIAVDLNGDEVLDLASTNFASGAGTTLSIFLANSTTIDEAQTISLLTQEDAEDMLEVFDNALDYINAARANIGAIQARLDIALSVNSNTIENIASAQSQMTDADMATETAEFVRLQILQTAGIAVLSQSNSSTRYALKLLQNI